MSSFTFFFLLNTNSASSAPRTPTRPSGHKAPTRAPPRRRRHNTPVESPIRRRGSSAETEEDEREVAMALTPLNFHLSSSSSSSSSFQQQQPPANSFSSHIFNNSAVAPPDQQRQPVPDYVARHALTSSLSRQETVPFWAVTEKLGRMPSDFAL